MLGIHIVCIVNKLTYLVMPYAMPFFCFYIGIGINFGSVDLESVVTITGRPILHHVLDTRQKMDTVITLADGKIGAHRMVLTAASPFLGELLLEQVSSNHLTEFPI
jgi:hypothetical protein